MSNSLLYHGFRVIGYNYVSTKFENGKILFNIEHDRNRLECPDCGSRNLIQAGKQTREFKALPVGKKRPFYDCRFRGFDVRLAALLSR